MPITHRIHALDGLVVTAGSIDSSTARHLATEYVRIRNKLIKDSRQTFEKFGVKQKYDTTKVYTKSHVAYIADRLSSGQNIKDFVSLMVVPSTLAKNIRPAIDEAKRKELKALVDSIAKSALAEWQKILKTAKVKL